MLMIILLGLALAREGTFLIEEAELQELLFQNKLRRRTNKHEFLVLQGAVLQLVLPLTNHCTYPVHLMSLLEAESLGWRMRLTDKLFLGY